MKRLALTTLSLILALSLCPTFGFAASVTDSKDDTQIQLTTASENPTTSLTSLVPENVATSGDPATSGDSTTSEDSTIAENLTTSEDPAITVVPTEAENLTTSEDPAITVVPTEAENLETAATPMATAANAAATYIDADGSKKSCTNYTELDVSTPSTLNTGWYVVKTNGITIPERITIQGDVHLIISNGVTFTAGKGITVNEGNALTIYGESYGGGILEADARSMVSDTSKDYSAGIGSSKGSNCGAITINSGNIRATGTDYGAGIGGSAKPNLESTAESSIGTITVNGGYITPMSGKYACAIGTACDKSKGSITINGGSVNAYGGDEAGIGCVSSTDTTAVKIAINGGAIMTFPGNSSKSLAIGSSGTSKPRLDMTGGIVASLNNIDCKPDNRTGGVVLTWRSGAYGIGSRDSIITDDTYADVHFTLQSPYFPYTLNVSGVAEATSTGSLIFPANSQLKTTVTLLDKANNKAIIQPGIKPATINFAENPVLIPDGYHVTIKDNAPIVASPRGIYLIHNDNGFSIRPGAINDTTEPTKNFLGARFIQEPTTVADALCSAHTQKERISNGRIVDLWLTSTSTISDEDAVIIQNSTNGLKGYHPIANFGLTSYSKVDGEDPLSADTTKHDVPIPISLLLPDSVKNTDPSILRDYKIICVYQGKPTLLPCSYDADNNALTFKTNRFSSFGLIYRDKQNETTHPVMVHGSYASESGQGEYNPGEKVTIYAGKRDGYTFESWSISPQDEVEFIYKDSEHAEFIMPDSPVIAAISWTKDAGNIYDVTDVKHNALSAALGNTSIDLGNRALNTDALNLVSNGMDAHVWLKSVKGISKADEECIDQVLGDRVIAEEVDLTLFYEINGNVTQVHNTNAPLTISFTLPDSALVKGATQTQTYEVIRVHNGKVDTLPAVFDENTHSLTFDTDKFSAYAVVYKHKDNVAPAALTDTGDLANTGDNPFVLLAFSGVFIASGALAYARKRQTSTATRP